MEREKEEIRPAIGFDERLRLWCYLMAASLLLNALLIVCLLLATKGAIV